MAPRMSSLPASIYLNLHMAARQSISSSPLLKHLLTHLTDRLLARGCGCCCGCSRFERTLLHWTLGTRCGTSNRVTYARSMWSSFLWIRALLFRRSLFRPVRDFINGLSRLVNGFDGSPIPCVSSKLATIQRAFTQSLLHCLTEMILDNASWDTRLKTAHLHWEQDIVTGWWSARLGNTLWIRLYVVYVGATEPRSVL